jgi:hypothetical protein
MNALTLPIPCASCLRLPALLLLVLLVGGAARAQTYGYLSSVSSPNYIQVTPLKRGFLAGSSSPSGGILATSLTTGTTLANISCPLWLTGLALSPNGAVLYAFGQSATGFALEP